jgi:AP-4 complex subunit beta-1
VDNLQPPMSKVNQASYFADLKKGEVGELRQLLRNPLLDRDFVKKREVVKKVIAYMTMGIDVSRLFSEMVMATVTKDLVQKKLVYLFLSHYAQNNTELALLAINTLQKDCVDEDPVVRGLALRTLTSLRVKQIVEYVYTPVANGLADPSAYVRKTAAAACGKLHEISPSQFEEGAFEEKLQDAVRDRDPLVVMNAVASLNEIHADDGGYKLDESTAVYLLSRLRDFNEWGQIEVMRMLSKFSTQREEDIFNIMNMLDSRLSHVNSAVVLQTVQVYLHFAELVPSICSSVYMRLKEPLITCLATSPVECGFAVLCHLKMMVSRSPDVYCEEFRHFFLRVNDPSYIQTLKLDILALVASSDNATLIVEELSQYVKAPNEELNRHALRMIGKIASTVNASAPKIVEVLLDFLSNPHPHVCEETIVVLCNVLRHNSSNHEFISVPVVECLDECINVASSADSKCAVLWMIAEYGHSKPYVPYVLEEMVDDWDSLHVSVQMQLLTTAMKVFFHRPGEMQQVLGGCFDAAIADSSNVDVHDRALLYYRLLEENVISSQSVILNRAPPVAEDSAIDRNDDDTEADDIIFRTEFNSLSVVFGITSDRFLVPKRAGEALIFEEGAEDGGEEGEEDEEEDDDEDDDEGEEENSYAPDVISAALGLPDLMQGQATTVRHLEAGTSLAAPEFQARWEALLTSVSLNGTSKHQNMSLENIEQFLAPECIYVLAKGQMGPAMKLYVYARAVPQLGGGYFIAELILNPEGGAWSATVKCDNPTQIELIGTALRSTLAS